jgi:hypothetical protein
LKKWTAWSVSADEQLAQFFGATDCYSPHKFQSGSTGRSTNKIHHADVSIGYGATCGGVGVVRIYSRG